MRTLVRKLDIYVPLEKLAAECHEESPCVFLDSSLPGERGRYSILGRNPYLTFYEWNGQCFKNKEKISESIEEALDSYLKENWEENPSSLPITAGALGYFSYDFGRKFEKIESSSRAQVDMPEAWFTFYDNLIIEDCLRKEIYITAQGRKKEAETSWKELADWVFACGEKTEEPLPEKHGRLAGFQADFKKEEYQKAIDAMIEYICGGDIYIANMTQQLVMESKKAPYEVFRYLRTHNPAPFGGYLNYGDFQIVCASPERFLKVKGKQVETRPVKGTRKRGETPEEDERLKEELAQSEKDRSELLMIVDLERNDLNHVCKPQTVKVMEHFAVETYATVFHLVSTVMGELREEASLMELIKAAFPGGSITGAPKIRAMEIIEELELSQRGIYTGSIGYLSLDGSCDFNIVIRTAVFQKGKYHLGVGGGITCESDTEFEYEETLQKAKAIREAVYDGENG
ncbi:MAG: aminodeoxychorismate synthase component I [Ruminococcus sp.]